MSPSTGPARWPVSSPITENVAAHVLAAMQTAVFEPLPAGRFHLASVPPKWFRALDEQVVSHSDLDLVALLPALESFLPEAQEVWNAPRDGRACSDLWSESRPGSDEVYLQAWALKTSGLPFLIIEDATTLHHQRQLVLQYAHETALQNDTIARLIRGLEYATQAKSDFLAMMSHEIRTPINAIVGMADVLAETSATSEQRRYLDILQRAAGSLLNLLNDVLDMAKIEAGQLTLETTAFRLRDVISRAVELATIHASEKGLTIEQHIASDVPAWVNGDPVRLHQILTNLLGNAIKFTERGGITVRVTRDPQGKGPVSVLFAVSDTGIGIAQDRQSKIFERYAQAEPSTTRKYGGTGLGLTICKRFVEAMGGSIQVESSVGLGSTFFFTVEFGNAVASTECASTRHTTASVGALRILVADDSCENQAVIRAYLEGTQCKVMFVEDGAAALKELKSGKYDAALLDLRMPIMNGVEVMLAYREYERTSSRVPLPVFALTADVSKDAIKQSLACGFTKHLSKPIRKATLLEEIARVRPLKSSAGRKIDILLDEGLCTVIPRYLDNVRRQASLVAATLAAGDFNAIVLLGHNMSGTGSMIGLPRISQIGEQLEQEAREQNAGAVNQLADELIWFLDSMNIQYK